MKRTISILLSAVLLLVSAACGAGNPENAESTGNAAAAAELQLVDSTVVQAGYPWCGVLSATSNQLTCDAGEEGYTFELHACQGSFCVEDAENGGDYPSGFTLTQSGEVYWMWFVWNTQEENGYPWAGTRTWIEVLIRQGEDYVGYAVAALVQSEEETMTYYPILLTCRVLADGASRENATQAAFQKLIEEAEENDRSSADDYVLPAEEAVPTDLPMVDSTAVQASSGVSHASGAENEILSCTSGEEGYHFELHVCAGRFFVKTGIQFEGRSPDYTIGYYTTDFVLEGSGSACWEDYALTYPQEVDSLWTGGRTFVEIFLTQEEHYVGYAVVALEREESGTSYSASLVECKVLAPDADAAGYSEEAKKKAFQLLIEAAERQAQ